MSNTETCYVCGEYVPAPSVGDTGHIVQVYRGAVVPKGIDPFTPGLTTQAIHEGCGSVLSAEREFVIAVRRIA